MMVKICGMRNEKDIEVCLKAGADALGFVVEYPVPVPWNLTLNQAEKLLALVPPPAASVLVMAGPAEWIEAAALRLHPTTVQLHGDEDLEETAFVCRRLEAAGVGVVKALRLTHDESQARFSIRDPLEAALRLAKTGIKALVLDTSGSEGEGGTGHMVDWDIAARIREAIDVPMVLAGGLKPENVAEAVRAVRPWGVDVISGIEFERGIKDPEKIKAFIAQAKGVN